MPNHSGIPYSGAPYNFITQRKPISREEKELPAQNKSIHNGMAPAANAEPDEELKNLYSGEFHYTVEALTDIFVGGSEGKKFYTNADGNMAIPGSTIRGLVRGNMKILGIGELAEDVDDYRLMHRTITNSRDTKMTKRYHSILGIEPVPVTRRGGKTTSISICKEVQAGYIYYDGKHYWMIMPNGKAVDPNKNGKQNYYTLCETDIIKEIQTARNSGRTSSFEYLEERKKEILMYQTDGRYPFGRNGFVDRNAENHYYRPNFYPVSFQVKENKVIAVAKPGKLTGSGCFEGYLMNSGFMNKKKIHYLIPAPSCMNPFDQSGKAFRLTDSCIRDYKKDYEVKKNLLGTTQNYRGVAPEEKKRILEQNQRYYELPKQEGQLKPVFFIGSGSIQTTAEETANAEQYVYLGFTPYLRLFFKHSIAEGILSKIEKPHHHDYAQAILGYSKEDTSRKSRVAFEDAVLCLNLNKTDSYLGTPVSGVFGVPKASSYMDYVVQESEERNKRLSYNDSSFELRGFKQYWLHEKAMIPQADSQNDKVKSGFVPILAEKKPKFSGTVRFKNLRADELGLLLWCFCLENDWQQNIGKAKPYGYGRIRIEIDQLRLYDFTKLYRSDSLDFSPWTEFNRAGIETELKKWIDCYKKEVKKQLGKDIMDETSIKQFGIMKNYAKRPSEEKIRYMSVREEYSKREHSLPYPEVVIGEKPYRQSQCTPAASVISTTVAKGNIVKGKIKMKAVDKKTNKSFGYYITIGNEQGLLHHSKFKKGKTIDDYKIGQEILVEILERTSLPRGGYKNSLKEY